MQEPSESGFTVIELLVVCMLIGVLSAIVTPYLLAAKAASNEASAIGSLRAIHTAQSSFAAACGNGRYAVAVPTLINNNYLSPDMGFNPKSGYNFALAAGLGSAPGGVDCTGQVPESAYYASGTPTSAVSGRRAFAVSAIGTIWQDTTGVPPTEPFTAGATTSPIS